MAMSAAAFDRHMLGFQQRIPLMLRVQEKGFRCCTALAGTTRKFWRFVTRTGSGLNFSATAKSPGKVMSSMTLVKVPCVYGVAHP